MVATLKLIAG